MRKRPRGRRSEDYTPVALMAAAIFVCAIVAVAEDVLDSATGIGFWETRRFHPFSIFAGALAFAGLFYFLQRMNDRPRALHYVEPYAPLVVLSGANVALKLNGAWLLPVALASVAWSVARIRKLRRKPVARRLPEFK